MEGGYDWGTGFVTVSGQHIDSQNVTSGAPLLTSIPDRISGVIGLRFLDQRLTVGTRLTLVDKSVVVLDTTGAVTNTPTKGYGLVDLFAAYRVTDDVNAELTVKNLFNRQYTQYLDTLANPGVVVKASISVRFASK